MHFRYIKATDCFNYFFKFATYKSSKHINEMRAITWFCDLIIWICQFSWQLRHSFSEAQVSHPWGQGEHSLEAENRKKQEKSGKIQTVIIKIKIIISKLDLEWCISSTFKYDAGGPGFDSHPGWHFLEALISLFLTMTCKTYSWNAIVTCNIWCLMSQTNKNIISR